METEAQYFHASPYKFQPEAWRAVIAEFCRSVNNVEARCSYDEKNHMFLLSCPTDLGGQVNPVLGDKIANYIAQEIVNAEREDREPRIRHFAEDVSVEIEEPTADALPDPTSYDGNEIPVVQFTPLVFHVIAAETVSTSSLKFFKLRDIGEGMLDKVLTAKKGTLKKIVENSTSCRVARWSKTKHDWVFNGRKGIPLAVTSDIPEGDVFRLCTFAIINNGKFGKRKVKEAPAVPVQYWKFVGDKPTVHQWIEGMGEIELVNPDEIESETPRDAAKFQKKPIIQTSALGRLRVPKAAPRADNDLDSEESDSEDGADAKNLRFRQLLQKDYKSNVAQDGSYLTSDSDSDNETFEQILGHSNATKGGKSSLPKGGPPTDTPSTQSQAPVPASLLQSTRTSSEPLPTTPSEQHEDRGCTGHNEYFPEHGRFAKVDDVGLTSNAANQAQWEHANPKPKKAKANRSGVGWRPKNTSSSEDAISQSTAPKSPLSQSPPTEYSSTSKAPSKSTTGCVDYEADAMPWTNKVVRPSVPTGRIIDDTASHTMAPIRIPPGLPVSGNFRNNSNQPRQSYAAVSQRPAQNELPDSHAQSADLIDFTNNGPENKKPNVKLPTMNTSTPSKASNFPTRPTAIEDTDDYIPERLQQVTNANAKDKKQNTMRQQAGKRGRASKPSSRQQGHSKTGATLEKPEPPPPPKKNLKSQQSPGNQSAAQHPASANSSKLTVPTSRASGSSQSERARSIGSASSDGEQDKDPKIPEFAPGLANLVHQLPSTHDLAGAEIKVQFGLLLVRHTSNKHFLDGAYDPARMQARMQTESSALHTDFFPRLTTSENDARFLLNLVESNDIRADVEYEIKLKTSNGEPRLLKFEQSAVKDFLVLQPDKALAELYMHYPMRVWDAKCTVLKQEVDLDLMEIVSLFVSSIQTDNEQPPSFLASLQSHSFSIEKVYAKRIFCKAMNGIDLRVTEVRELTLSSVDADEFNFRATAGPAELMIEDQKMWWECSLHTTLFDTETAVKIHSMADDIVSRMDCVGYGNQGPLVKVEPRKESAPLQWFEKGHW